MQLFDPNNPNEKKKMIVAAVLGLAALLLLGYLFLGGSSSKPNTNRPVATATPTPRPPRGPEGPPLSEDPSIYKEIAYHGTVPQVSEADRNIFAYYEPPPPPVKVPSPPPPTPTPPLVATSLSPQSVYARTGDFSLQVMGDKFVAGVNITIDGRMMQTRFISAQQLATTVPADMIANPGTRQVTLKNANGTLYSNNVSLVVTPPPLPNFNYVGLIGKPRFNDWAVLQDKSSKELINVQRGDVVGGRFRVNSISDKEVVLIDTNLKIRHTVTFTTETANSPSRPPARRPPVDDEP
jgi:IPT/TIG domain